MPLPNKLSAFPWHARLSVSRPNSKKKMDQDCQYANGVAEIVAHNNWHVLHTAVSTRLHQLPICAESPVVGPTHTLQVLHYIQFSHTYSWRLPPGTPHKMHTYSEEMGSGVCLHLLQLLNVVTVVQAHTALLKQRFTQLVVSWPCQSCLRPTCTSKDKDCNAQVHGVRYKGY